MSALSAKLTPFTSHLLFKKSLIYKATYQLLQLVDVPIKFEDYNHIYVDVSVFAKADNQTGIQRVVREVIFEMLNHPLTTNKINFVIATKKKPYRTVPFTFKDNHIQFEINKDKTPIIPINLSRGDVFIGLDFCPNIIPSHLLQLVRWRMQGAVISWVIYDLLPLHHPEWFPDATQGNFEPWLKTVLLTGNRLFTISNKVAKDITTYAQKQLKIELPENIVQKVPLGYLFSPKITIYKNFIDDLIKKELSQKKFILMVGTLEPRKGHLDIITAFDQRLDSNANDLLLVIAGKKGWKTQMLIEKIQKDKNIMWLEDMGDAALIWLYQKCQGVILASYDEGFGLPLLEAMAFNKYILARDIPIFREVSHNYNNIDFFLSNNIDLTHKLNIWVNIITTTTPINEGFNLEQYTWKKTVSTIIKALSFYRE